MADADKYSFLCEHYEEHSQMTKEFLLTVYARRGGSNEVSIFDLKHRRAFLKRGVYEQDGPVRLEDLYVGGTVTICSRKFKVVSHADAATRELYARSCEQVFTMVGSEALPELGTLLTAAAESGFVLRRAKMVPGPGRRRAVAMELVGSGATEGWLEAVHRSVGSAAAKAVTAEPAGPAADKVLDSKESTATFDNCSLCIIRPHAVREGQAGAVVSMLLRAGLEISALQTYSLVKSQAETFCEVYKTVIPSAQYGAMITELASGTSLMLEVRADQDVVPTLRELCGPYDVEIARHLRPTTIRALYGRDNVHNVVHCTDLPEDGVLECQYFFSILPNAVF